MIGVEFAGQWYCFREVFGRSECAIGGNCPLAKKNGIDGLCRKYPEENDLSPARRLPVFSNYLPYPYIIILVPNAEVHADARLTIVDTTADAHYKDDRKLAFDLAEALNFEIRALSHAGCKYIQLDEPVFARNVALAMEIGVECLERCFDGLPDDIRRVMHMCCG